ncbi:ferrochelatase [Legionella beliardensis]|uniref:Ferrochelatase n=1 Tax=Legionella beliardensis TaxID=91822 RepID=A0A378HYY5_9GAMM|nr:ferrochelatase [Legionella beliardensis]STX28127.1 ferrochelatase [Legionella beliardensis]
MKNGLLLINLGTPNSPNTTDVRRYLREFLADKRVINLSAPLRYLLLYLFILPFRPKQSAHAYQAIWTEEGSPLLINHQRLMAKLKTKLNYTQVALAMQYGKPSINEALEELQQCTHLTILPLYPQYSSAATGAALEKTLKLLAKNPTHPSLQVISDFYCHPSFITAQAALIKPHINNHDYILFSYHGIPERHLTAIGCQSICKTCPPAKLANPVCYKAQCQQTTQELVQALSLPADKFSMAFQSRLGKTPWIKPYTDYVLSELRSQGVKRLAVVCPSFVADCLETLEEIGIRAREQWLAAGGEVFTLIPCLNDSEQWAEAIMDICHLQ